MKRTFQHPAEPKTGKKYWRSVEELADTPKFREWLSREFPAGAAELEMDGLSRRSFVQLMGASLALAGLGFSGCRRPEIHFAALSKSVEWSIPGKALYYTSAMPTRTGAVPLVVTTYDGRPTKIEGNPLHPASNGATTLHAQASILDLYNPDRSKIFLENGKESDRQKFDAYLAGLLPKLAASAGAGLAFLADVNNSPTRERLKQEILKKYPQAKWAVHDPTGSLQAEAVATAFGPGVTLTPQIEKADVIVALDSDFLGLDSESTGYTRQFAARRKPPKEGGSSMNRLYVVENRYTLTGGMADHRLRLKASQIPALTVKLAQAVANLTGNNFAVTLAEIPLPVDQQWIDECAADLVSAKGKSLIFVGPRQPVATQILGFAINSFLGNIGQTITGFTQAVSQQIPLPELVKAIQQKAVSTLFILESNPVYTAPVDLKFDDSMKSVTDVVHLGLRKDETALVSKWHVPGTHYLESWSDALGPDGTYVPVQPMIQPLFGGLSANDVLAAVAGLKIPQGAEVVKETFAKVKETAGSTADWSSFLRNGYLENSAPSPAALTFSGPLAAAVSPPAEGVEVVFPPDYKIQDGSYIDNGWLQELPDPITKLTWDNAALMSRKMADKLGIGRPTHSDEQHLESEMIKITVEGRSLEVPAMVAPGHADDSITLPLGYGHAEGATGKIGRGSGFNAYQLVASAASYFAVATVEKTGKTYQLAITQEHNQMEGRAVVREATLEHFEEKPEFAKTMFMDSHSPPNISLYKNPDYTSPERKSPEQWGMVIDLNSCVGCNACVIACQAENNIPIVGKEQVINNREMHWLRIDRYFASAEDEHNETEPEMVMQPLGCQQCENAPCETVCPVNATVHSDDGLNVMVYNRCIGTRYCANNCPFKVRRFNFFNYNERPLEKMKIGPLPESSGLYFGPLTKKGTEDLIKMQKNPNVTVRIRGVMEKCTYCIQRIEEGRIQSRVKAGASDNLKIPTDSIQSACQQACAAEAITFGDLKDPDSRVAKLQDNPRRYRLLEYLNVQTRTSYLARLRNPNPKMPGAGKVADIYPDEHAEGHDSKDQHQGEGTHH
ncbi:MAG TPA: TAT-variant-translocated molybdopterin oxidoreductase [Chthoniobacterales bacterium]